MFRALFVLSLRLSQFCHHIGSGLFHLIVKFERNVIFGVDLDNPLLDVLDFLVHFVLQYFGCCNAFSEANIDFLENIKLFALGKYDFLQLVDALIFLLDELEGMLYIIVVLD